MPEIKTAYKGTDANGQCRGHQYEVGKTYEIDGDVELCKRGFHACENPFDVWSYYPPAKNRFFVVEQSGEVETDSCKTVSGKIEIKAEFSLIAFVMAGVEFILKKTKCKKVNSGYRSAAVNSGNNSAAVNSGYRSAAVNSGNNSAAVNSGDFSAAVNSGDFSAAVNSGNNSAAVNSGDRSAAVNSGNNSAAVNSGDFSAAVNSGYLSAAVNSGVFSAAETTQENSISCALGIYARAKAERGWIVVVDWQEKNNEWKINNIHHAKVGRKLKGKRIRPNVWYWFEGGELKSEES